VIHIAGSKGKGSTCAMVASILREAGHDVGLYTSPHLVDFRERIRILHPFVRIREQSEVDFEGKISEAEICTLLAQIKPYAEQICAESKYGPLSFFEIYTALAFLYFQKKKVDFAIMEVGLGGRLDATNVVSALASGITPISLEHTDKLGATLETIAREKAGIIKDNSRFGEENGQLVVSAPQDEKVLKVLRETCAQRNAQLYEVGRDIHFKELSSDDMEHTFKYSGLFEQNLVLTVRLLGQHQIINAATAAGIVETLRLKDIQVSSQAIQDGLVHTVWPGRLEIVQRAPLIILDGAQNVASAVALRRAIRRLFSYERLILVLGISKDKDIQGVCRELVEICDCVVLTKASHNPRVAPPERIRSSGVMDVKPVTVTQNVAEAIIQALSKASRQDLILITGSLFVAGEAREILKKYARADVGKG
jgi:dihydrofolate synthase/folylpolyglutamate synthase